MIYDNDGYIFTITDEEAYKSLEIYLTKFKLKELELSYLFDKASGEMYILCVHHQTSKVMVPVSSFTSTNVKLRLRFDIHLTFT